MTAWAEMGHTVVDINLKGVAASNFARLLGRVESKLFVTLDGLEGLASRCTSGKLGADSVVSVSALHSLTQVLKRIRYFEPFFNSWALVVPSLFAAGFSACIAFISARVLILLQEHRRSATFIVTLLTVSTLGALFEFQPKWREPLSTAFKDGDFARIMEACNTLAVCDPAHRPILVVREVQNLDAKSSDSLFSSLEQMKEGWFHFPVFLETSDFQWYRNTATSRSAASFQTLYLADMDEHDVRADVVDRYGVWTQEDFSLVWDAVGGHGGSLSYLFKLHKLDGRSLADAIGVMDQMYGGIVGAALSECRTHREECETWLKRLRHSNFSLVEKYVPDSIHALFDLNVLFVTRLDMGGNVIVPQNRLLERAIERFVGMYMPDPSLPVLDQHRPQPEA